MSESTGPATNWDLDKVMGKINALIRNAEDESLPEEARASYRAKAEQLMRDYRVQEEELIAEDQFSILPIAKKIVLVEGYGNPFSHEYHTLFFAVVRHTGLQYHPRWARQDNGKYALEATVVGYASDIRYAEFLWASARLMFATNLEPSHDPKLSDQENCYRLRNSGMERWRIAQLLWGSAPTDGPAHGKVQRLYKAECAQRGEAPRVNGRTVNAKTYRQVYAKSFVDRVWSRLRDARDAVDSVGGGIELKGRAERVLEKFYELFPEERPQPVQEETTTDSKPGKAAKPYRVTKADLERHRRMNNSPAALAGKAAGRQAADAVEISRTSKRAQRLEQHQETTTSETYGELEA